VQRKRVFDADCELGYPDVYIPETIAHEDSTSWQWQYLFAGSKLTADIESKTIRRNHIHASVLQKAIQRAGKTSGINKDVNSHILRHTFAVHLLEAGADIQQVQELLGHSDVSLTMLYKKIARTPKVVMRSPADLL